MKKIKNFAMATVISVIATAICIELKLGLILFIIPVVILMGIILREGEDSADPLSGVMALLLAYSVMFSPWGWTSMLLAGGIVVCHFCKKTMDLSPIAAWILGAEAVSVCAEALKEKTYFMDNLWHDIAVIIFVIYVVFSQKKEVAH